MQTSSLSSRGSAIPRTQCLNCSAEIRGNHYLINKRPWCDNCAKPYVGRREGVATLVKAILFGVASIGIVLAMMLLVNVAGKLYYGLAAFAIVSLGFKLFYTGDEVPIEVERVGR